MNKKQYEEMRNELIQAAEALIGEGKFEDSQAKMKEVETLDNQWEETKLANANLAALKDKTKGTDLEIKSVSVEGAEIVDEMVKVQPKDEAALYENAWAKNMMNKKLTNEEEEIFNKVNAEFQNAYTHDTGNTGILIPETVAAGIWARAAEAYPLFNDVKKFNVKGKLTIKKHVSIDAGDAAWYDEATSTADEQNTFGELNLDGHELSKAVTVSWKLKAMAIADFIPYIISELGERVGVALGTAIVQGSGSGQPHGIATALLAEAGTPQVVTYDPDNATTPVPLSYAKVTAAIGKVHSSYLNGAKFYVNNATIWSELVNVLDASERPYFQADPTGRYTGMMFGFPVVADAGVPAGDILFGNANKGYVFNTNEPFSVVTEDHAKARTTDYVAYAVVDGDVMDEKAFALIRNVPNA